MTEETRRDDATGSEVSEAWLARMGYSRQTRLWRDAAGRWFDGEQPIEHVGLCRAFDGWVDRAPDGRPCLRNAIHWVYVRIEGPYYFVQGLRFEPDGAVRLLLSGGREAPLRPETLREAREGGLWCSVFETALPARFDVESAQRLVERCGRLVGDRLLLRIGRWEGEVPVLDDPLASEPQRR